MKTIREARDTDVNQIRDLFVQVYGKEYPFKGFYDTEWLKKAVYDDGTFFLIMEMDNRIVATVSMMLTSGGLDDMIGEIGRLVATTDPKYRGKGLYTELTQILIDKTTDRVQFLMGEARTPHRGSQKILEELHWTACGFEPMKYLFGKHRESTLFYIKTQGMAKELRKNNPRVISEASVLAQTVLKNMNYPVDIIVENEVDGYPIGKGYKIEHLKEQKGVTSLLRIERGRVSNREIFGNFSLSHGFFRIGDPTTNYLIAKEGDAVLGAVGFIHDPIDKKIRIFELIEFDDAVKGFLLSEVDRIAREEFKVDYMEVDVSAYSPKIQRTFERLGFVPIAYCPSMVFQQVERLDVIRMTKLCCQYDPGEMRLLEPGQKIIEIVEKGFEDRMLGMEITDAARKTELFKDLADGELYHLARIARTVEFPKGHILIEQDKEPDNLYIFIDGSAEVTTGKQIVGNLSSGNICGEMALIDKSPRSANVILTSNSKLIKINIERLERLMESRPRLGYDVVNKLAGSLSSKLKKLNLSTLYMKKFELV